MHFLINIKLEKASINKSDVLILFNELFSQNVDFGGKYFLQTLLEDREINCEVNLVSETRLVEIKNALYAYRINLTKQNYTTLWTTKYAKYWRSENFVLVKVFNPVQRYEILNLENMFPVIEIESASGYEFVVAKMLEHNVKVLTEEDIRQIELKKGMSIWNKISNFFSSVINSLVVFFL